jgi:hypothetical protein
MKLAVSPLMVSSYWWPFDICMIATVKLVRPDELLSLIREAADHKADITRLISNVRFWG